MAINRFSGILAHPTSFPSPYGIGDLGKGAFEFIDFLKKSNQKLWQVLPLGPTSFGDSPYQSFSTFAGNPMLISPDILLKQNYLSFDDLENIPQFEDAINYGQVIDYKSGLLKKAYINFKNKASNEQKKAFDHFCKDNSFWLNDFALFIALKQYFIENRKNTLNSPQFLAFEKLNKELLSEDAIKDFFYGAVWNSWPEDIKMHESKSVKKWNKSLENEVSYYKFLQFEFFREWDELKKYANDRDIKIIGDIPIFVAMDSSDVWTNKELYFLDEKGYPTMVAGVPPDYFSATGQLWGNPLYNWEQHKKTNYAWWISRIKSTLKFVDILRVDHFIGFVRYWSVPYGSPNAIEGSWGKGPSFDI
jgi:4-alpha-glucanotransferase